MTWIYLKGNMRYSHILINLTRLRREGTRAHMGRWLHPIDIINCGSYASYRTPTTASPLDPTNPNP